MNISTTGALIYVARPVTEEYITFKLNLNRKSLTLKAKVLEQEKIEGKIYHRVRCQFVEMSRTNEKILHKLIIGIKKKEKKRLQGLSR